MNGLVVLAACVCAVTGQLITPGLAPLSAPSSQFHAQDEFGQFSFGHAGGPVARTEARNGFGVTTGGYQYIDAYGQLQSYQYVSDPLNGFRVSGTNLPVAPAVPVVAPLAAPVFDLPLPVAPEDTAEVKAAKEAHAAALAAAEAAAAAAPAEEEAVEEAAEEPAAERKRREAEEEKAEKVLPALPYPYALGALGGPALLAGAPAVGALGGPALLAGAPADIVAKIDTAVPTVAGTYTGLPLGAGLPLAGAYAGVPLNTLAGAYAGAPVAPVAAVAAAAPSREAIKTTVKLNPGHAIFYRVD